MKKIIWILPILLTGCLGDSSRDNELSGQVKKIHSVTPILCPNYKEVDVSLRILRNGMGSVSNQDMILWVPNDDDYEILKKASENGSIVKIKYDVARDRWFDCVPRETVSHAEIIQ